MASAAATISSVPSSSTTTSGLYLDEKWKLSKKEGSTRSFLSGNSSNRKCAFSRKCARLVKEQRARFYIMRRCVAMLICWRDYGDSWIWRQDSTTPNEESLQLGFFLSSFFLRDDQIWGKKSRTHFKIFFCFCWHPGKKRIIRVRKGEKRSYTAHIWVFWGGGVSWVASKSNFGCPN